MSIIGSSSILIRGFTGPDGPIGPAGPTGNIGITASGCTGSTGADGIYVDSVYFNIAKGSCFDYWYNTKEPIYWGWGNTWSKGNAVGELYNTIWRGAGDESIYFGSIIQDGPINIKLNDGTVMHRQFDGTNLVVYYLGVYDHPLIGATAEDSSGVVGSTLGPLSLFLGISNGIFQFRSLGVSGSGITIESTSNHLYIDGNQYISGNSGFGSNSLLYFTSPTTIQGITLNNGLTLTYIPQPAGTTKNAYFDLNTKILQKTKISTVESSTTGITLDLTQSGVYYIHTPNSILGFTGTSTWHSGTVYSATLIVENDYLFKLPSNIWFPKNNNTLSCGENIINITTIDAGKTWLANIFGKGFRSTSVTCNSKWDVGSCTTNTSSGATCTNYINRWDCEQINGTFCLTPCVQETDIYEEGSCCINGVCKDGVSKFICNKYRGRFWSPEQTGGEGCNAFTCWDPCFPEVGSCCLGITCLERYTESECDLLNGRWNLWDCSVPFPCDPLADEIGACCLSKTECELLSWRNCALRNGLFMGIGEQCADVECNCFEESSSPNNPLGCDGTGVTFTGTGVKFTEYKIDLSALNFDSSNDICFEYTAFSIPDRFIITRTNHENSDIKEILQGLVAPNYTNNQYKTFAQQTNKHPAYLDQQNNDPDGILINGSTIFDSSCIAGTHKTTITINPNDIETDSNNPWYKQLRLWIIAGCSGNTNYTLWKTQIDCQSCTDSPPPPPPPPLGSTELEPNQKAMPSNLETLSIGELRFEVYI